MLYRFFDLVVGSNVDLGGTPLDGGVADCVFTVHDMPMRVTATPAWSVIYETPTPWLSVAHDDDALLIRIHEMAEFRVGADGTRVDCHPLVALPAESVSHLFVDQVLPLLLARQGKLVLHASAVSTPHGVVAFIGETGLGKSTLAASFSVGGQPALTDDCLLVKEVDDRWVGCPSYGEAHLWPDVVEPLFGVGEATTPVAHYTDKRRVSLSRTPEPPGSGARRLCAVYALADGSEPVGRDHVRVRRLTKREAFHRFINNTFRAEFSLDRARHELETLTRLAAAVPMASLCYPRQLQFLPAVRRAVLRDAKAVTSA